MKKHTFLLLALLFKVLSTYAQTFGLDEVESLRSLPSVSQPALSPDDRYLLYVVTHTDIEKNSRRSSLMLLDLGSQEKKEIWQGASEPQWSPDGSLISFKTSIKDRYGIYILPLKSAADPQLVAEVHTSNHFLGHETNYNYAWSPDGKSIAFVSADPDTGIRQDNPNAPRVIDRSMYKSRTGFSDLRLSKIYLASLADKSVKLLSQGDYDSHSLCWSPDSKQIAFISNRTPEPDHNYNNELWTVDVQSLAISQLTHTSGTEHQPAWGKAMVVPATRRPVNTKDSPAEDMHLYEISLTGQKESPLAKELDRNLYSLQWLGDWLYFLAKTEGKAVLYRLHHSTRQLQAVIDEKGMVGSYSLGKNKVAYSWQSPQQPGEIFICNTDGKNRKQLTVETSEWMKGKTLSGFYEFWFTSFDGTRVQGFILLPAGPLSASARLPVIHRIHGGPHGMFGYAFVPINEVMVAKGYAVVMINPRGSTGYGQRFTEGTLNGWGAGDYKDLMIGMDSVLQRYPVLDANNIGVNGGSYGGFMTNWILTQTQRYKAAVSVASVSNLISFYGTSIYQDLIENEFNGFPWNNYNLLWHYSPLAHVQNVNAPVLLMHGEMDMDVPIGQSEEFYMALRKMGLPVRLLRYPNEGHSVRQPQHLEHFNRELLGWFDTYLRANRKQ